MCCGSEKSSEARSIGKRGLLMAKGWRQSDCLVLIEIGGNDLLMGVSSSEYGRALDALLSKVAAPNRTVVMFELPLLPNKIAYG